MWLTKSQIQSKYGGDEALASEICNNKLMDPETKESHVKWHPDAPGNEARLIHVTTYHMLILL